MTTGGASLAEQAVETIQLFDGLSIALGTRQVLDRQSLSVSRGEIVVLMGPSGVGKSVLAAVTFGVSHGAQIRASGTVGAAAERGALVFQHGGGLPHLTVAQNLRVAGASASEAAQIAQQLDLRPAADSWSLSGGESRRLATGMAFAAQRDLLWLDEPAAGLDVKRMSELARELREQATVRGVAIVVTTHRLAFAEALADRVVFFNMDGTLRELGSAPGGLHHALVEALDDPPEIRHSPVRRSAFQIPLSGVSWLPEVVLLAGAVMSGAVARSRLAWWKSFSRTLRLALVEGALFYPFVGAIFGAIFVLVFDLALTFLDTAEVIVEFGPTVIARLAPPFAAILVSARSGSSIGSWVGQMSAGGNFDALKVLGVSRRRSVGSAAFAGLALSNVISTTTFAGAIGGVFAYYASKLGGDPSLIWEGLAGAEGMTALGKSALYGVIVGAIVVAQASRPMTRTDEVATAITRSIVLSTIFVMVSELASLAVELGAVGG